ncbi:aminotransferase class V-fold PLP-dependent enzyme [Clostridium sediminicola]|uniref:aminotransferase class V-fold PLP-dependent enzyme n=1 Tax=Clostridium sediminicola TaxID=3114879 RepID=UPI0031F252FC
MNTIYLDNSATSFPKPKEVADIMYHYITEVGSNVNRGAYQTSYTAENVLYETRELLADFFNYNKPENVIFTKNITESLNILIKSLLKENDHVIVSSMEHNAVMRPLNNLRSKNITYDRVPCFKDGSLDISKIRDLIQSNTKAIIMTHASNVCGTILDLETVGEICKENNLFFIVDTAQTAGSHKVDMKSLNANAIAFTGHKGLLGPQGIGGFIVDDKINEVLCPFIEGGTGSLSELEEQPNYMPDKFESGTLNIPGIYGLNAAIKYINEHGISSIREHELFLTNKLIEGLKEFSFINIIGKNDIFDRTPCVSIDVKDKDLGIFSHNLSKDFGIMTRCGLHCAPSAHKTLGTFPRGTIRFSIGLFNTIEDIQTCIDALEKTYNKNNK